MKRSKLCKFCDIYVSPTVCNGALENQPCQTIRNKRVLKIQSYRDWLSNRITLLRNLIKANIELKEFALVTKQTVMLDCMRQCAKQLKGVNNC